MGSFPENSSPQPKRDPTHKIFLLLRGLAVAGGLLWTVSAADRTAVPLLLVSLAVFGFYSLVLIGVFRWTQVQVDTLYRIATPCDAAFIFTFIELDGDSGEVFLLAYCLLVGLHAYYFGLRTGLVLACSCGALLAVHERFGSVLHTAVELIIAVGFLLLLGGTLGWLSERQKTLDAEMEGVIQELQQTGHTLKQSERVAMLGRLTSSIAHEINNPISAILTRLECMLQEARDEGRSGSLVGDLQVLLRQTRRLADLTGSLLRFARPVRPGTEWVDVNESIERAVQWIEHRLPEKELMLNLNLSSNLPRVRGNAADLEEAVMNLLANAVDACCQRGQIYVISALSGGRQKTVQIFVSDTGEGIDPEHLDQVFDPFFTTKKVGAGTGLGLFITHEIVREQLGTIEVETEPGKGTTFVINLPVVSTEAGVKA